MYSNNLLINWLQLGYDIPNKERRKRRKESDEDLPSFGKKSMEKKNGGSPIRVSAITRDKDLRTNKEQPKSGNLGKTKICITHVSTFAIRRLI